MSGPRRTYFNVCGSPQRGCNKNYVRIDYRLLPTSPKKCRANCLSIDCQLDLFDRIMVPAFLYGCKIWGFSNLDDIEKIHLKYCKYILGVNMYTPNYMVYGELGRIPLSVTVKTWMINFWANIISGSIQKYSAVFYNLQFNKYTQEGEMSSWLCLVKIYF